jgi:hypothetical protein
MVNPKIDIDALPWDIAAPGARFNALRSAGAVIRAGTEITKITSLGFEGADKAKPARSSTTRSSISAINHTRRYSPISRGFRARIHIQNHGR